MSFGTTLHRAVLHAAVPLSRVIGKVGDPLLTRWIDIREAQAAAPILDRPGLVFVTRKRLELSNVAIPGHFTHAAIASPTKGVIVQAIGVGVVDTTLDDFLTSHDEVAAYAPTFADTDHMLRAAQWAYDKIGDSYNYEFSPYASNVKSFWCSELVYTAYLETVSDRQEMDFKLYEKLGVKTVVPEDFVNAAHMTPPKFTLVWKSRRAAT